MRIFDFFRLKRGRSFVQNWELTQDIYDSKRRGTGRRLGLFLGLSILLFVFIAAGIFLVSQYRQVKKTPSVPDFKQKQLSPAPSGSPPDSLLEVKDKFLEEKTQVKKLELKENIFKFPEIDWQIKVGDV